MLSPPEYFEFGEVSVSTALPVRETAPPPTMGALTVCAVPMSYANSVLLLNVTPAVARDPMAPLPTCNVPPATEVEPV